MKTSVIEVGGMLSALSARGVEKQLGKLPGFFSVGATFLFASDQFFEASAVLPTHDFLSGAT